MAPAPIPVGLSTRLGLIATAVLAVAALVAAVLNGDHTTETITALIGAVITLVTVLQGRYGQAQAREASGVTGLLQPGVNESVSVSRFRASDEPDDEPSAGEHEPATGVLGEDNDPYDIGDLDPAHERRDLHEGGVC